MQNLRQFLRSGFNRLCYFLFAKAVHLQTVICKPLFHLHHRVGVIKVSQFLHFICQLCFGLCIKSKGILHHIHIKGNAAVIDFLV